MKDAGIASPADVHFVQIKCPLLTKERIEEAARRGATRRDRRHLSFDGAVARRLGAGRRRWRWARSRPRRDRGRDLPRLVALFERRQHLGRRRAAAQRDRRAGQRAGWAGDLVIDHDVMKDAIDADAARAACWRALGRREPWPSSPRPRPSPSGEIRGRRHTMLDDSDIHSTRHARALVGGVLAGVIGDTDALCLRRRRAPGPRRRRAGRDHCEGLVGPRPSQVGGYPDRARSSSLLTAV